MQREREQELEMRRQLTQAKTEVPSFSLMLNVFLSALPVYLLIQFYFLSMLTVKA